MLDLFFALVLSAQMAPFEAPMQASPSDAAIQATQSQSVTKEAPVHISSDEEHSHMLNFPLLFLRANLGKRHATILVQITVDTSGAVSSATASCKDEVAIPQRLFEEAEAMVRSLHYKPFERDGHPVSVTFEMRFNVLPPELPSTTHVPFPRVKDWKSVKIKFARIKGVRKYGVEVDGDGSVLYEGLDYAVFTGVHRAVLSQDNVIDLVKSFEKADYFSLRDEYRADDPRIVMVTYIEFDGRRKRVVDANGEEIGMPMSIRELENSIMMLSGVLRWTEGNDDTMATLLAEHWDFRSAQAAETLARAAAFGKTQLVRELVLAGVPLNGKCTFCSEHDSALESAAKRGDLAMLRTLLQAGAGSYPGNLASALTRAARSGKIEALHFLLENGGTINMRDSEGQTVLMAAAASGSPAMVREVLKANPDVNAIATPKRPWACPDSWPEEEGCPQWAPDYGRTALMFAVFPVPEDADTDRVQVVRLLLDAGADVNVADKYGNTVLIHCVDDPALITLLLQAGADPNARNNLGETPLSAHYDEAIKHLLIEHGAVPDEEKK